MLFGPNKPAYSFAYKRKANKVWPAAEGGRRGWRPLPQPCRGRPPLRRAARTRGRLDAEDRLGGISHRLDVLSDVKEGDDAARAALQALVAPRKSADEAALVQHELDVAADILGMKQPFLECPTVEREHIGNHLASGFLVRVFETAEELRRGLAVQLGELRGEVGPHVADGRVHGVVAGARIHAPPLDLLLQHPMQGVEVRPRVIAEVLHEILFGLALVVAVPAGMQDYGIALADIGAGGLDDLRGG